MQIQILKTLEILNSTWTGFNRASSNGAVISNGWYTYIENTVFTDNIGSSNGLFYNTATMVLSTVTASKNKMTADVGILYNNGGNVIFENETLMEENEMNKSVIWTIGGGTITFNGKTTFRGNLGNNEGSVLRVGTGSNNRGYVTFNNEVLFERNRTNSNIGTVFVAEYSTLTFNDKAVFYKNSGNSQGGVIHNFKGTVTYNADAIFISNERECCAQLDF